MTGIVFPPRVTLLTYTEFAMFLTLSTSRLLIFESIEYLEELWWTAKGRETAWTARTKHRTSRNWKRIEIDLKKKRWIK